MPSLLRVVRPLINFTQCRTYGSAVLRKASATIANAVYQKSLADGSLFISRVPDEPNMTTTTSDILPPPLKPVVEKKYHLTEADQEEMRRLRNEDPAYWTQKRLAEKFQCSRLFVALVAPCPEEHRAKLNAELEAIRERHGYKRRLIAFNRKRRRELW
jgi:hypothetical protein